MDSHTAKLKGKKVLFVITKSNWGGAQAYVYALATDFTKRGADVVVAFGGTGLAGAPVGLLGQRLQEAGIRTILVHSFMREVSTKKEFGALAELRHIIRTEKPYILHLNSSKAGGIGALAGRLESVPRIVYTAHGWAHREPRNFLVKTFIWLASWITVLLSHAVIVVSKLDFQNAPIFFSRKKLVLVRNGISQFSILNKEIARERLAEQAPLRTSLATDGIWLLMNSELHINKGVDVVIRAMPEVLKKFSDAKLVVMSEGGERRNLEALIKDLKLSNHVFLLGFVTQARSYLKAGDIFLMPSRKEGMPFALLEAGFAELPVIASSTGGIPEVIQQNVTGLLVPPNNSKALSEAILDLLGDSAKAQELAHNLKMKIDSEFSEEKMLDETAAVYVS